jgi:hypothetical protein
MSIKSSYVEKLKNQRRELSIALWEILVNAKPSLGTFNHTVPSSVIKSGNAAYRKIWRKP